MNTDNQNAPARDIPVPPGGGSWSWDESLREWVSNDPQPQTEAAPAEAPGANLYTEQEQ
jgi:hypothetical protein